MLVIDVAQLVTDKNCIKNVLLLKIQGLRAPLAHPSKSVAVVGAKTGVATHINKIESYAYLIHCHVNALQFVVGETIKATKITRCTLDAALDLNKLIKYSVVQKSNIF